MADSPRNSTPPSDQEPGHHGAGDGEAPPAAAQDEAGTTTEGDDGEPVVFTPADVHVRPPDRPPTDAAPESEKAGLIFERS
jgi:hypothetical protein